MSPRFVSGWGRGPTRFMSPRRMLTSWGSSSSRNRLSHRPRRVIRSQLSCSHSDFGRLIGCIVRNLISLNDRPNSPTRSWTKNPWPRERAELGIGPGPSEDATEVLGLIHHADHGVSEIRPPFDLLDDLPRQSARPDDQHALADVMTAPDPVTQAQPEQEAGDHEK